MSRRTTSFIVPPAASTRCLILVKVSLPWLYTEPSPSTPPAPSPAVIPASTNWLPETRQSGHVLGAGPFTFALATRDIFMALLLSVWAGEYIGCPAASPQRRHVGSV